MFNQLYWRELPHVLMIGVALALAGGGLYQLSTYKYVPGPEARSPDNWPSQSPLVRNSQGMTALLFLHPLCPCSTVTVAELERWLHESGHSLEVQVVFVPPVGVAGTWETNALARRVENSPQLKMLVDQAGVESRRFGVKTSGHFLLFDATGGRLLSGGLTNGRGMEGPSAGLNALGQVLAGLPPEHNQFPVYGCALSDSSDSGA